MKVNFGEVHIFGEKRECCIGCGNIFKRRKKFWQTLNPFNKTKDGQIKTREQIIKELAEEKATWLVEPIICRDCEDLKYQQESEQRAIDSLNGRI